MSSLMYTHHMDTAALKTYIHAGFHISLDVLPFRDESGSRSPSTYVMIFFTGDVKAVK